MPRSETMHGAAGDPRMARSAGSGQRPRASVGPVVTATRWPGWARTAAAVGSIGALVGAATLTRAAWNAHDYRVNERVLPLLPAGETPVRVLHLSDAHMVVGQRTKVTWLQSLAQLQPDLVVNTGDNLTQAGSEDPLLEALGPLMEFPGAFVPGSNCYYAARLKNPLSYVNRRRITGEPIRHAPKDTLDWPRMHAAFEAAGWVNASNSAGWVSFGGGSGQRQPRIAVTGVDDPHLGLDRVVGWPSKANDAEPVLRLGLTHAPYRRVLDALATSGADLILSGHTHGGQIAVPGYGALTSNSDMPTGLASGLGWWAAGGRRSAIHVSQGIGTYRFAPLRSGFKPGATLLHLIPRGH